MTIPLNISFLYWAATLVQDYPQTAMLIIKDEKQWRDWANQLSNLEPFASSGVPSVINFNDWQSWAMRLFQSMSNT